jgi:hypothetical protein
MRRQQTLASRPETVRPLADSAMKTCDTAQFINVHQTNSQPCPPSLPSNMHLHTQPLLTRTPKQNMIPATCHTPAPLPERRESTPLTYDQQQPLTQHIPAPPNHHTIHQEGQQPQVCQLCYSSLPTNVPEMSPCLPAKLRPPDNTGNPTLHASQVITPTIAACLPACVRPLTILQQPGVE